MSSKAFRVVIFSVVLMGGVIGGIKFYQQFPRDYDVIKEFVLNEEQEVSIENPVKNKEEEIEKEVEDISYKIEKDEVGDELPRIHKGQKLEVQSIGDNKKEESLMYSALSSDTITIKQESSSDENKPYYLTDKSVIVEIKGTGPTTITIAGKTVKQTESGQYSYVCKVADNVQIKSGSATKNVKNIVKVSTGVDGGATNKRYVKDKNGWTAILGGEITGADGVKLSSYNIQEHGVRYWRGDMEDEIYTVIKDVESESTKTLKFEVKASSLKENTTYYMQAYMINSWGEVLLGDIKEFSTRGQGSGLYRICYNENKPKKIKQERKATMNFVASEFEYNGKVRWVGEIMPVNNGVISFRVTSPNASGSIKISNGVKDIYASSVEASTDEVDVFSGTNWNGKELTTKNVYQAGKKYPIVMEFSPASAIKIEWKEDGEYQEIPKEQLYPKEYVKILSAVVNSVGTNDQKIDKTTGKLIGKKVITDGKKIDKLTIGYNSNNIASTIKIDNGTTYTIGENYKVSGCIIYNKNGVFEPITENVSCIDYGNKKVTLRDGSKWALYGNDGVDIVGRAIIKGNKKCTVYDLGRYIDGSKLSDGKSKSDVYRVDKVDDTYILDLYNKLGESPEYQAMLEQYSTMERLVEDAKPVNNMWNTGIGDARVFSQIPIRVLLSFDGDTSFEMKDPVIKISKTLYRNKSVGSDVNQNMIFKNEEVISSPDDKFKLLLPVNGQSQLSQDLYANWRYMNKDDSGYYVESSNKNVATMWDDNDSIYIKLDKYSAANQLKDAISNNVVMLNFMVRLNSYDYKTSDEIFASIENQLINNGYVTYTKAVVDTLDGMQTEVIELPIKINIKSQITFE